MKENLECNIIQDLLPNYIEKLTTDGTNHAIEEHLNSCENCQEVLKILNTEIKTDQRSASIKELKFFNKISKTKIIAALLSIILSLTLSYMLYAREFKYTNDKGVLSTAITQYTSGDRNYIRYTVDAYVLETKEIDGNLIVFFKDVSNPNVYGFARLVKGFNQRYRLIRANFGPSRYSAVVQAYEFEIRKRTYYAVGGHNLDSNITSYGLTFNEGYGENLDKSHLLKKEIKNTQFLDLYNKASIQNLLSVEGVKNFYLDRFKVTMFNDEGDDITEEYYNKLNESWGSGTGTAELFVLYVLIGIVLIIGFIFARYFLTD